MIKNNSVLPMTNPNFVSPRVAMGLPPHYVSRFSDAILKQCSKELSSKSIDELVEIAQSIDESFSRRYTAGTLLGLFGDPRVSIVDPKMVRFETSVVTLGTPLNRVPQVLKEWHQVGIEADWISKECPTYKAELQSFAMTAYLITNMEFRQFLMEEECSSNWIPSSWILGSYPVHHSNHPVWTILPEAAEAYAVWLSRKTGRQFRLPTEAEWEFAAAGADRREYPWGNEFNANYANTLESGPHTTTPVGIYRLGCTESGLYDMAGNVEEFTASNYDAYPGGKIVEDDLYVRYGHYRVARGGSFSRYGDLTRCRRRHGYYDSPIYAIGFRLAETL